jgi:hypothetical protein
MLLPVLIALKLMRFLLDLLPCCFPGSQCFFKAHFFVFQMFSLLSFLAYI